MWHIREGTKAWRETRKEKEGKGIGRLQLEARSTECRFGLLDELYVGQKPTELVCQIPLATISMVQGFKWQYSSLCVVT